MKIIWHSNYPEWLGRRGRYGTMAPEEIAAHLEELADEAARALAEERAEEGEG